MVASAQRRRASEGLDDALHRLRLSSGPDAAQKRSLWVFITEIWCKSDVAAGFVLDPVSVILIVIPIAVPIIKIRGFDPIWFCILFLVVLQTSYLTPPTAPSITLEITTPVLVLRFPGIALWLPQQLLGF